MPLHEMGKDAYCFSVLDLKDKISDKDAKITEELFEVRALFLTQRDSHLGKLQCLIQ